MTTQTHPLICNRSSPFPCRMRSRKEFETFDHRVLLSLVDAGVQQCAQVLFVEWEWADNAKPGARNTLYRMKQCRIRWSGNRIEIRFGICRQIGCGWY